MSCHVQVIMNRDILVEFYSKPQLGGSLQVFQGTRRQVGGSFLSSLARFAIPVLKFLGKKVLGSKQRRFRCN